MPDSLELFPDSAMEMLPIEGGDITFMHAFFPLGEADAILAELMQATPWRHQQLVVYGKSHLQPRLTAFYGDMPYTYSGLTLSPLPWTAMLLEIKSRVEQASGHAFNTVLLNLYRDGNDRMGWHSDDEAVLGRNPAIASVSFGQSRKFQLKHRHTVRPTTTVDLTHGSLLLMQGPTQHNLLHAIPKSAAASGPRINLTFRAIKASPRPL